MKKKYPYDGNLFDCTRAMNRLHLFANGSEIRKSKMDEMFSHWVYEDQFIAESGLNTLYLHIVSQAIMCLVCLIINMIKQDTWSYFDELKGKNIMG